MKKRLETLTRAHGVSGDESAIRAAIRQAAEPYADDITEDALGNLIVHQKGAGKKIMLAAHMDSVGVIVTHIEQNGFLRFGAIGGLEAKALYQTMVRFQNGTVGVIAVEESKEEKEFKLTDLYIDIGARDREEAKTMVMVGDTAAFSGALSGNGNRVMGPYLDNRAGCAVLLETMQQTQHPTNDLYYVFTTQEEVGMRGAKPAAWAVDPEYALAVDVTCPDDQPGALHEATTKLGGGAGGHNGLKSIDAAIGPNYNRVRLGIGHPDNGLPPSAVVNHVLAGFSKADQAVLEHNILLVTENIGLLLKDGVAAFSNRIGNLNKSTLK